LKEDTLATAPPNQIRKNDVIRYKGDPHVVLESIVRTPPNLSAFVQMDLRSLTTGKSIPVRCSTKEQFEVLDSRSRQLQFSYENRGEYVFMDPNTYDQFELRKDVIKEAVDFLVPNQTYEVLFVEDHPTLVVLPSSVEMKVVEAAEAVRGNTATNVTKPVTLETGLVVQAPLFIKIGEILKISTKEKEYLGRA